MSLLLSKDHEFKNASEDYAWLNLSDEEFDGIVNSDFNPLLNLTDIELKRPGLREYFLMKEAGYIYFLGKVFLNIEIYPLQAALLYELSRHNFSILLGSRGLGKSSGLAIFALMQMLMNDGIKIVAVGAAFRQSKLLFNYAENIWKNSPVLQDMFKGAKDGVRMAQDRATLRLGNSTFTCLPLGDGSRIRGERANIIIADEFNSINLEIYQTVIQNFAAVSADPIGAMKKRAYMKILEQNDVDVTEFDEYFRLKSNKSIISGTMGADWEPLNQYVNKYKSIILSKGSDQYLKEIFGEEVPKSLRWQDFMVATIPFELIPPGFLDQGVIEQAKMTMDIGIYAAEFGCCPVNDTNGFYRKAVIDACTATTKNIKSGSFPEWCPEEFTATTRGNPRMRYVFGIDPAHTSDNFAITILELHNNHTRVVYCWTTNKKVFAEQKKLSKEENYWAYCARKVRELWEKFPTEHIVIDAGGGGLALAEALRDRDKLTEFEVPFWPVVDPDKKQDTDLKEGLHNLHLINMTQPWNADANYALQKDLYDKIILFPNFDCILAGLASEYENSTSDFDRLEDVMMEIEEMKKELITIVRQKTPTGKERWDTPDSITGAPNNSKNITKMRKDRFSSLLLANSVARLIEMRNTDHYSLNRGNFAAGVVGGQLYKTNSDPTQAYMGRPEKTKDARLSCYRGIVR